jgi:hypothetical protein
LRVMIILIGNKNIHIIKKHLLYARGCSHCWK